MKSIIAACIILTPALAFARPNMNRGFVRPHHTLPHASAPAGSGGHGAGDSARPDQSKRPKADQAQSGTIGR